MDRIAADESLRARMAGNVAGFERWELAETGDLRRAAVALVVAAGDGGTADLLLTRRSPRLPDHPGQWALPGGVIDGGEDATAAAFRELHEELGVVLPAASLLGSLDDYVTRSGFCITPVVLWGGVVGELRPNPAEVAAVIRIGLDELDDPAVARFLEEAGSERPVIQLRLGGHGLMHAPTAALIYQFVEVALHGRSTRVRHLAEPGFPRA